MMRIKKTWHVLTLLMVILFLLVGCSEDKQDGNLESVNVSVERTGGLLTGIGKVKVYIDGDQVMKVKNNQIESVELYLSPGTHEIQTKGQGDRSKVVKFEVVDGKNNTFAYHTEISNIYGLKLELIR